MLRQLAFPNDEGVNLQLYWVPGADEPAEETVKQRLALILETLYEGEDSPMVTINQVAYTH